MESHAGRLWTTPNEEPGTRFHFSLPQYQEVVAYGYTHYPSHLTPAEPCKEIGCNGFAGRVPLVVMVDPKNVHLINEDGTFNESAK